MRVGLFVDVNDQFFRINNKWPGRKLNYEKYFAKAATYGEITRAIAYGTQSSDNSNNFVSCLHHIGFEPRFKSIESGEWFSWAVCISVDVLRLLDQLDIVIIGYSAREMSPLLSYLKETSVRTIVLSCGINRELKLSSDTWVELDEEMLEEKINIAE